MNIEHSEIIALEGLIYLAVGLLDFAGLMDFAVTICGSFCYCKL